MYSDLIRFWQKQDVQFFPAKENEVVAAEQKHGSRFPPEFREYLLQAGGMKPYDSDNQLFEFYMANRLESWAGTGGYSMGALRPFVRQDVSSSATS